MRLKRHDGSFKKKFDALNTHGQGFIEGNAWNYSLYVPHQPAEMIELMGGKIQFRIRLDSLFTMKLSDKYFEETEDISSEGIIGNYVHENEPFHHIAYLYNWTDAPWKSQDKIDIKRPVPNRSGRPGRKWRFWTYECLIYFQQSRFLSGCTRLNGLCPGKSSSKQS